MQRLTIDRAFLAEAAEAFAALGMNDHASRISAVLGAPDATPVACAHEWTDDGEFTLTCTKCSKKENHEPYGWVQTRVDAINHFTQEWDVVESWVERGFEYKAMFDHAEHPAPVAVGTVKMHGDMKCIAFGDEEWKALNVGDIIFATGARV